MKKHIREFCLRGTLFAWGGPVIMAIIWMILQGAGVVTELTVNQVVLGIFTTTVMAFIAAGISIVYHIEKLPRAIAGLIQMSVLYVDYLGFYLLNGWISWDHVWIFTVIFAGGFILIWSVIYLTIRLKVSKMNRILNGK